MQLTLASLYFQFGQRQSKSFLMMIEGRLLLCLQMTSAEAHEAVRKAGLGEGMSERDAFVYNETGGLAAELEFFSHRWHRSSRCACVCVLCRPNSSNAAPQRRRSHTRARVSGAT